MSTYPDNYETRIVQGDAEWFALRCGCVTASRVAEALSFLKRGGSSAEREKYKLELLAETITGKPAEHYVSPYMDEGREYEPLARTAYELTRDVEVEQIGYAHHPRINRTGASPDGLVGEHGLVEIKCPKTTTHLTYLMHEIVPAEYVPQMMWQMACTGRAWCDFVSYDGRLPDDFGLFIVRLERDDKLIAEMEEGVEQFIGELNAMCEKLLKGKQNLEGALRASVEATKKQQMGDEFSV